MQAMNFGVIAGGRTLLEGSIAELLSRPGAAERYKLRVVFAPPNATLPTDVTVLARAGEWWHVSLSGVTRPAAIWRAMLDGGVEISEIQREAGGLEELYLTVTESAAAP